MKLIRDLHRLKPQADQFPVIATIGNFDGMHLGHQALLQQMKEQGLQSGFQTLVMMFTPHPKAYFLKKQNKADTVIRLMRFRDKWQYLDRMGVDRLCCLRFNQFLSMIPPREFIEQYLIAMLQVRHLLVGDDFRFGVDRQGDFNLLQTIANERDDFEVTQVSGVSHDTKRISSTAIRVALQRGDLLSAQQGLGRRFSLCGCVAHGEKLGRTLGFPTINIHLNRPVAPLLGIYAVKVQGLSDQKILGVASVGTRPTVGGTRCLLEVYLFDFDREVYGEQVEVIFYHKIRDEECYESLEKLKHQIEMDAKMTREYFC